MVGAASHHLPKTRAASPRTRPTGSAPLVAGGTASDKNRPASACTPGSDRRKWLLDVAFGATHAGASRKNSHSEDHGQASGEGVRNGRLDNLASTASPRPLLADLSTQFRKCPTGIGLSPLPLAAFAWRGDRGSGWRSHAQRRTDPAVATLRAEAGYWKSRHADALRRNEQLQDQLHQTQAEVRQLQYRLFGRKTECRLAGQNIAALVDEDLQEPVRKGGGRPGHPGHRRQGYAHLPAVEEFRELAEEARRCLQCGKLRRERTDTEGSQQLDVKVRAYGPTPTSDPACSDFVPSDASGLSHAIRQTRPPPNPAPTMRKESSCLEACSPR